MDPKPSFSYALQAPPSNSGPALRCPAEGEQPAWPRLDDHLVEPEVSRDEVVRGQRMHVMGAQPPHADCQARLTTVLTVHAREGYISSTELQTRSAFDSDFASDFCIRKKGLDPRTGVRYLEELLCEVISEQKPGNILNKAEDLELRGVRRIFGIFLKERQVREWRQGAWHSLPQDGVIEDECLVRPLSVRAILDAAEADDEVARALLSKHNPVLMQRLSESLDQGRKAGMDEMYQKWQGEHLERQRLEQELARAEQEKQRAEQEKQRAEQEKQHLLERIAALEAEVQKGPGSAR